MMIKVLLADNDLAFLTETKQSLEKSGKISVVAIADNGEKCMQYIAQHKPDVVVLDILLSKQDGFVVLESLDKSSNTKALVLSSLTQEGFVSKAMRLGAAYYMFKPQDTSALTAQIIDLVNPNVKETNLPQKKVIKSEVSSAQKQIEEKITNIFITVGIPAHIKGYKFLREAIKIAIESPDIINAITKRLYPTIATKFSTSASKVERAIRFAIEVAWDKGKIENINALFGIKIYSSTDRPTNGEFIALVADKMLLEAM